MPDSIRITILVDNSSSQKDLLCEHGLSLWIEYAGKNILFDTGQSDAVVKNAQKLGLDLSKIDIIVLSHGHYDHTGGLGNVLDFATNAHIYLHTKAVEPKYSCANGKSRYIGISDENIQRLSQMSKSQGVTFNEGRKTVFNQAIITGQIPRNNKYEDSGGSFYSDRQCLTTDSLIDDQALLLESSKGLVVVLGCAHSGVVNTLDYISTLTNKNIYAVIGGMHLVNADYERMNKTIAALKKYNINKIIPLHCTGKQAVRSIKAACPEQCLILETAEQFCNFAF